jgi:hypothetical protein
MVGSLALLIKALSTRAETPVQLLCSAASLWVTNILVFALWYWRLDAGGPNRRDQRVGHPTGAFLFPQMVGQDSRVTADLQTWSPNCVDYLFLAFNTSTALSPTDVPVLSRWAKLLMMLQAMISFSIVRGLRCPHDLPPRQHPLHQGHHMPWASSPRWTIGSIPRNRRHGSG